MNAYVELEVGGHVDGAVQAWVFEVPHWGLCGQGLNEQEALAALEGPTLGALCAFLERHGEQCHRIEAVRVVERVHGDEQAFERDRRGATDGELERTLQILEWARSDLLNLLAGATDRELDWDDPERIMPSWASWRTLRQMAWHIADTESRYYLHALGVPPPPRASDLVEELERSALHVRRMLPTLDRHFVVENGGEVWTTTKVLRRLAWHERGEIDAMRALFARARRALR